MDNELDKLHTGLNALQDEKTAWERRQQYYEGQQDLPAVPTDDAEDPEIQALLRQCIANWTALAMDGPVQRLAVESLRNRDTGKVDSATWNDVWLANDLDSRSKIVWIQKMVHGRGIWSVSKVPGQSGRAKVSVENTSRVYMHRDPADPFTHDYAVKTWISTPASKSSLWVPDSARATLGSTMVAVIYDAKEWVRYENTGAVGVLGKWDRVGAGLHGLDELPFVQDATNLDADGVPHSAIEALMPAQDAINQIRFYTLRAASSAAFRQKVFTGLDPRARDAEGEIIYMRGPNGDTLLDQNMQPIPVMNKVGRLGVDRALVFPGADTKVTDLDESNLSNYTNVLQVFLTDFLSRGQVPPAYALDKMANLSGDALAGAEATLQSLVNDLRREGQSAITKVMRLTDRARGRDEVTPLVAEWEDTEPKSFAQIVDGVVKLIGQGFPRRAAFEMLPGATPTKVDQWLKDSDADRQAQFSSKLLDQFTSDLGPEGADATAAAAAGA